MSVSFPGPVRKEVVAKAVGFDLSCSAWHDFSRELGELICTNMAKFITSLRIPVLDTEGTNAQWSGSF